MHATRLLARQASKPRPGSSTHLALPRLVNTPQSSLAATKKATERAITAFAHTAAKRAAAIGITYSDFTFLAPAFISLVGRGALQNCSVESVARAVAQRLPGNAGHRWPAETPDITSIVESALFPHFVEYCESRETPMTRFRTLREFADLSQPEHRYPATRAYQRKIIMHVGPTNSGKTYQAMQRLESCTSGLFLGPLRLLAHEIFDRLNAKGITCNLITGEERRIVDPEAVCTSCTVEMADTTRAYDVAVIDEIQLIADPQRGWAWTEALLALRVKELHLCGEPSAVPLIKKICAAIDEEVEVHEYKRLNPLQVAAKGLGGNLRNVLPGDCVVAFSRKSIFELRHEIETKTRYKCAVIYGALPPETRAEQARLFNNPDSGYDVLIASDAVGLGLNLQIKRVVFESMFKFDGHTFGRVQDALTKQIAGRAGRFGLQAASAGLVTTLSDSELPLLKRALAAPPTPLLRAGVQPTESMLALFSQHFPGTPFSKVLRHFHELAKLDSSFFICNAEDAQRIAEATDSLQMAAHHRFIFLNAPMSTRHEIVREIGSKYAKDLARGRVCHINAYVQLGDSVPKTPDDLAELELTHKAILLYLWLYFKIPYAFPDFAEVTEMKKKAEDLIEKALEYRATKGPRVTHGQR